MNQDRRHCVGTYKIKFHSFDSQLTSFCKTWREYVNALYYLILEISENDEDTPHNDEMDAMQNYWPSKEWSSVFDGYQEHKAVKKESCPPGYFLKQKECKGNKILC